MDAYTWAGILAWLLLALVAIVVVAAAAAAALVLGAAVHELGELLAGAAL